MIKSGNVFKTDFSNHTTVMTDDSSDYESLIVCLVVDYLQIV